MNELITTPWEFIVIITGAGFALYKYLDSRRRELDWQKTRFLFEQGQYIDNDPDIIKAIKILAGENPDLEIGDIFGNNANEEVRAQYWTGFDKLFNFLDRLAHTYFSLETLSGEEVRNFRWYLDEVIKNESIKSYCEDNGYQDVVKLAQTPFEKKR